MFKELFGKQKYATITLTNENKAVKKEIGPKRESDITYSPDGLFAKCGNCEEVIYIKEIIENKKICTKCGTYFRMSAWERVELIADSGTFVQLFSDIRSINPLNFPNYDEKIRDSEVRTGLSEAVLCGSCEISGLSCILCIMDTSFIMGSMGSVLGERITLAAEQALRKKIPIIIFTASGGARMQEGIFSLMQMAKCSAAIARLGEAGILFVSVLTDPTTGGVSASFAFQGDIILAEQGALVGFAGTRVIEQTIKQKLPEGFQRAEFLLEHGLIDNILERKNIKETLGRLLMLHKGGHIDG